MQKLSWSLLTFMLSTTAVWADVTVKNDSNTDLALSIYSNTALVRDVRQVNLPSGKSSVLFAGVAGQMKPETLIVNGSGLTVREQTYNFAMLSPETVARANKGYVSRLERGLTIPSVSTLYRIAAAMGLAVELRPIT